MLLSGGRGGGEMDFRTTLGWVLWQHLLVGAASEVVAGAFGAGVPPWCASCPLLVLLVLGAKQRARQPALIAFRSRCLLLLFLLSHYSSAREGLLRTGTP